MKILFCVTWYLRQLLPLLYRTYYADGDGNVRLAVWRMWFGRCFACDDVVLDPFENCDNPKVREVWSQVNEDDEQALREEIAMLHLLSEKALYLAGNKTGDDLLFAFMALNVYSEAIENRVKAYHLLLRCEADRQ